jgi:putative colanic acid biosynthesis UDP-glucose lipid carrier transferase
MLKHFRRKGRNYIKAIIIGSNETAQRLYDEMLSDAGYGYRVVGFFDDTCPDNLKDKYLGTIEDLEEYIKREKIDEIYYTLSGENSKAIRSVIKIADNNVIQFYYVPQLSKYLSRGFEMYNMGAVPVLTLRRNPLSKHINRFIKRAFDITFSSIVLLFSPIIFIPVAIAIKISSPGPIFFKQLRTGYRGRDFHCWKFRTMRVNADSDKLQAQKNDPRKTKVGDFLRKTSIDELPQFINVFLGSMSVVGPRPHMLKHTQDYSQLIDKYMVRHLIKPGITGWAQANGWRGQTEELWQMEKRVEYDVWYIEHWTFLLDIKIIIRTVLNAIHGEKNAF